MTFKQLQDLLDEGVQRDDLTLTLAQSINEAFRDIQQDYSFVSMKSRATVTIPSGSSSVAMPSDFKALQKVRYPVHLVAEDGSLIPIECTIRERALERTYRINNALKLRVFVDEVDDGYTLATPTNVDADAPFEVSYYKIWPDLSDDSDTNFLTVRYPRLVVARARMNTFAGISDSEASDMAALYAGLLEKAIKDDTKREVSGRRYQMGGG